MSAANVEAARRGFEAALTGDVQTIGGLLAPDVKWHGGDPSSGCQNRDEVLHFMQEAVARGRVAELVDVLDAGDQVVVVMQAVGAAGQRANVTTFRDGKVVEIVAFENPDDARAAAGI